MLFKKLCRTAIAIVLITLGANVNAQTLVWSDEFRTPKLDPEKWNTEVGGSGFGNGELQYYTSGESNIFIGSKANPADTGYLVIEARKENYGVAPENRSFTSGRINTSGKFNFKYGTVVARIKLPNLQNGLWPAFWMLGANYPTVGWPRSGEIDILEAGFKDDWQNNVANKKVNTTVHWFQDNFQEIDPNAPGNGWWGNASATGSTTIPGTLNDDFHVFKITWTPTKIEGYVDNVKYYDFVIPADPNFTEFSNPFYIIMNLAVGGSNFVGITDPNQITAPLPAQMIVDYVRVYSNADTESFQSINLPRETGKFGVFTETTVVNNSLGTSPTVDIWSNLIPEATTPQEGSGVLSFKANPGNWFGLGIPTGAGNEKNMQNFIDGHLHFHMKTTSTWPITVGIISTANGNAQDGTKEKPVRLDPAGQQYGLVRDGQWHEVVIPFTAFGNVEFRSMNNMFYLVGDNPPSAVTFAIDNIYWSDGTKITPQNGDYVIYSDTHVGVDQFEPGTEGDFFVWESTLIPQVTAPSEGSNVLSFTHNGKGWFGAAFTASAMHNLTAFQNSNAKLVFSLKTSDTTTPFFIGMKSGTRDGEGQKWIAFETGKTPYGFQRNGTWQTVEIPMSDLYDGVNLMEVVQLFQILGVGNISNIAFDNIYITGGGTAAPDVEPGNGPEVDAGLDKVVRTGNSVSITGSATSMGTVESVQWSLISGPNTPVLTNADTETVTATGLVAGTYIFRLTAIDDAGRDNSDDVNVFVGPNLLPSANAGEDKTLSLPATSIVLQGTGDDVDGAIATYAWTVVSGPNAPVLSGADTESVTAGEMIQGTYEFKLIVTDNEGGTGFDLVKVEVTPNTAPTADAGDDKDITLPVNSVTLDGAGNDSGIIVSYLWTQTSGPSTATIVSPNTVDTEVSNLLEGTYVFELRVTDDGGLFDTDEVTVTVHAAPINLALLKTVSVSSTENGTTPGSAAVDGNLETRWSSAFADPQWISVDLGATYAVDRVKITWEPALAKDYTVEISDDDEHWTVMKTITGNTVLVNDHTDVSGEGRYIRIKGTTRGTPWGYSIYELEVYGQLANRGPVVNAGSDITITLPESEVTIHGEASSANTEIIQYAWTMVSGPNEPIFNGQATAELTASGLVEGVYLFRLAVTDGNDVTAFDDVKVTVKSVTAIEDELSQRVKLYPNPSKTSLTIEGVKEGSSIQITSASGLRVGVKVVRSSSIDVSDLAPGLYVLVPDGESKVGRKFMKE